MSAGAPPFIIQEEFDRYSGLWWNAAANGDYRLMFELVDESMVERLRVGDGEDTMRYPLAGKTNASQSLAVAKIEVVHVSPE